MTQEVTTVAGLPLSKRAQIALQKGKEMKTRPKPEELEEFRKSQEPEEYEVTIEGFDPVTVMAKGYYDARSIAICQNPYLDGVKMRSFNKKNIRVKKVNPKRGRG